MLEIIEMESDKNISTHLLYASNGEKGMEEITHRTDESECDNVVNKTPPTDRDNKTMDENVFSWKNDLQDPHTIT